MGKRNPVIAIAKDSDSPAVRADGHLHRESLLQPVLGGVEREIVNALVIPKRVGHLPEGAPGVDPQNIVQCISSSGLISVLRDNARRAGLIGLFRACRGVTEQQRFIARERWNTATLAAKRILDATGRPPTALGCLAATHLVYAKPAQRLRHIIRFLVPGPSAAKARLAVADLRGVEVTSHIIAGSSPRSWDEAVRLRGSALVDEGWQLPSPEDAALLTLPVFELQRGGKSTAALVDLALLSEHPDFHWETFAQRAGIWRLRPAAWRALHQLSRRFGLRIPQSIFKQVEPSPWERLLRNILG